jgi:hypothetical protein
MVDSLNRWCLFCDLEVHPSAEHAPQPILSDYVDDLIALVDRGEAKRVFENETRITRIAAAREIKLNDDSPALAMLITLGDRRGSDPTFIHFDEGVARDPEKLEGEVRGVSAHVVIRLTGDPDAVGRYRMLIEEIRGIGRTPVTRLLASCLKEVAENRGDRFRNPTTNRMNAYRPIIEVHPRRSKAMADALDDGAFLPVDLLDTSPVPEFDENPEYSVRRHLLSVKVKPAPGRTIRQAMQDLAATARDNGYDRMRVSWRNPGEQRGGTSEMNTDLADVGTALFAHREVVVVQNPMTDCAAAINDEFVEAMAGHIV